MKIKIDIISGFLGSGKTTLLKKLVDEKFKEEKIAIIENEFGEVSIDTDILKELNLNIKEIKSGCICCSLKGDFKESIKSIIDLYSPERIIIEPSGVAKLSDIIKVCQSLDTECNIKLNMLITVLDASNAEMYIKNFGEFYRDQIKNAKTIVITRTENISEQKIKDTIKIIEKINPQAKMILRDLNKINLNEIIEFNEDINTNYEKKDFKVGKLIYNNNFKKAACVKTHSHNDNIFSSWALETKEKFTESKVKELFEVITKDKSYGIVLRGKGIIKLNTEKWIQFHYVPGQFSISDINEQKSSKICIIGSQINKNKLNLLFEDNYQ